MRFYSDLLNRAVKSMMQVHEKRDIQSLFSGGATTALTTRIEGPDDFELVCFIVIREIE